MKLVVDTHTHTIASGHAYSTVRENAEEAARKGLEGIAVTDHGPAMEGTSSVLHFWNLKVIPEYINGVRVLQGVEANVIDGGGGLDVPGPLLTRLDFVIAGFHDNVIKPGTVEENTEMMINALKNPFVDAIAHPGNPAFQVDIDRVVKTAAEYGKLIEINGGSFRVRRGSEPNCREFVAKCKKYGVRVVCGTDAHICYDVGEFGKANIILDEAGMPEELVLSTSMVKLLEYIEKRKASRKAYIRTV